eukprot:335519-Pyramimonas_sp.AAC.1
MQINCGMHLRTLDGKDIAPRSGIAYLVATLNSNRQMASELNKKLGARRDILAHGSPRQLL